MKDEDVITEEEKLEEKRDLVMLHFKDEGRDHKPKNTDILYKLEKVKKQILPYSRQKESSSAVTLILAL